MCGIQLKQYMHISKCNYLKKERLRIKMLFSDKIQTNLRSI